MYSIFILRDSDSAEELQVPQTDSSKKFVERDGGSAEKLQIPQKDSLKQFMENVPTNIRIPLKVIVQLHV